MSGEVAIFRTPEERFANLPDFPYEPVYTEVNGLRLAHIEDGEGPPVMMIHGEPAWSFIYRDVIGPIRDAGYRCVVPDLPGFGRSDKPVDPGWYGVESMVSTTGALFERLGLSDATLVCHDWGGLIGVSLAQAYPDHVSRVVILDTAFDPKEAWMNEAWTRMREFMQRVEDLPIGASMQATCVTELSAEVVAAYDAPFPGETALGGVRGLPLSIPKTTETPEEVERLYERLRADERPMLMIWSEQDIFLTLASGERLASAIGREIDHVIPNAGHGIQEDAGEVLGSLIAEWLRELQTGR